MPTVRVEYMDERGKGAQSAVLTEIPHGSAAPSPRTPHPGSHCANWFDDRTSAEDRSLKKETFLMTLDTPSGTP
jgi:hypothetical protein